MHPMADASATEAMRLKAVIRGARVILAKKEFAQAARSIFDLARELTGAVSGYVALLSDDGHENEVLFLDAGGMKCAVDPSLPMPIRGLRATAYETHQVAYENRFMDSKWVEYLPGGHVDMKNVLFAPLNLEGKTVGIMGLANKPGDFTDEDAEIASVFGEFAAIALANSRYMDLVVEKTESLEHALAEVRTLRGLLPICARCKSIRDDEGLWSSVEEYLRDRTDVAFTHGICPDCMRELYPDDEDLDP